MRAPEKIVVAEQCWDRAFAPSSCLTIVTTIDRRGRVNAASFGTCVRVNHDPVYLAFACDVGKDTTNNVLETGEFVVNTVPFEQDMLDKTLACGLPFKPGVDELSMAGLAALPSLKVKPPRVAECRTHFECSVEWTKQWAGGRVMICGKVEAVSADADCVDGRGFLAWERAKPAHYCGGAYQDRFVPAFDKPTRGVWRRVVEEARLSDDDFRAGANWRAGFRSAD